jgi:putative chitinase
MRFIKKLQFWNDAFAGAKPAPASPVVWHFHPLGFLKQLRAMKGVTVDQLQRILPHASKANIDKYIGYLNEAMERYDIDTPLLQAHFLAQVGHESASLSACEEYASGDAYEWRWWGLNNTRPGDGRRFKGRGLIQLTGRLNYSLYGAYVGMDLTANPQLLATDPRLACDVAAWFWRRGKTVELNTLATKADADTVKALTRQINGGYNGLDQRIEYFFNGKRVLID